MTSWLRQREVTAGGLPYWLAQLDRPGDRAVTARPRKWEPASRRPAGHRPMGREEYSQIILSYDVVVEALKDRSMYFTRICCLSLATVFLPAGIAFAQVPPAPYVAPAPILNPSSSLVVPAPRQVPVSPSTSGSAFGTGEYLRGTNEVVNPPRSVLHHPRRHRHAQR